MADFMSGALHWMNVVLDDDPHTSMQKYIAYTGPLKLTSTDYWVDWKDYFMYGDQFINYDPATATDKNVVAMPTATLATSKRYPTGADVDGLFAAAAPANTIKEDGIVSLTIKTRLRDMSATI